MLKIECTNCKNWIHSPLLAELEEMQCPTCAEVVPVKDVYIYSGPYAIYRDVLLKHMVKYKRLLSEAEKELDELQREGAGLKPYSLSADSVTMFISSLKEMLQGCRNGFRVPVGDRFVDCAIDGKTVKARLVNISTKGVCLESEGFAEAKKGEHLKLVFSSGGGDGAFGLGGEVVWVRNVQLGILFSEMDTEARASLLDYIQEKK